MKIRQFSWKLKILLHQNSPLAKKLYVKPSWKPKQKAEKDRRTQTTTQIFQSITEKSNNLKKWIQIIRTDSFQSVSSSISFHRNIMWKHFCFKLQTRMHQTTFQLKPQNRNPLGPPNNAESYSVYGVKFFFQLLQVRRAPCIPIFLVFCCRYIKICFRRLNKKLDTIYSKSLSIAFL